MVSHHITKENSTKQIAKTYQNVGSIWILALCMFISSLRERNDCDLILRVSHFDKPIMSSLSWVLLDLCWSVLLPGYQHTRNTLDPEFGKHSERPPFPLKGSNLCHEQPGRYLICLLHNTWLFLQSQGMAKRNIISWSKLNHFLSK